MIHTVIGVVRQQQYVLIAWRKFPPSIRANWEFPGGKRKANESVTEAIQRELCEELDIHVEVGKPIIRLDHDYDDQSILLDTYEIDAVQGKISAKEKQFLRWCLPSNMMAKDFPTANRGLIAALKLPHYYAITPELSEDTYQTIIQQILRSSASLILLRTHWCANSYERTQQVAQYIQQCGAQVMLHNHPEWVDTLQAAGVHFSQSAITRIKIRPVPESTYFSVSCHSSEEIKHAESLQADFCVLGAVSQTASHTNQKPLGMSQFQQSVQKAKMPVFALGGMRIEDLDRVRSAGGQGIAGIHCFADLNSCND